MKTSIENLPSGDLTPAELDRILENGHFQPKTESLLKDAIGIVFNINLLSSTPAGVQR